MEERRRSNEKSEYNNKERKVTLQNVSRPGERERRGRLVVEMLRILPDMSLSERERTRERPFFCLVRWKEEEEKMMRFYCLGVKWA